MKVKVSRSKLSLLVIVIAGVMSTAISFAAGAPVRVGYP
jgi:hypothetical protein